MSGLLGGALGVAAFGRSLVTSITAPSLRYIVWPVQGPPTSGTSSSAATSSTGQPTGEQVTQSLTGYIPIIEEHRDELTITEHPVEQGAAVTDHAFKMPSMLTLRIGWSTSMPANNPLSLGNLTGISALNAISLPTFAGFFSTASDSAINNIYATLLGLQVTRTLLTVATARRQYKNMLLQGLSLSTDEKTEHSLIVTATLKELILVSVEVVQSSAAATANSLRPAQTATPADQGQQAPQPITPPANLDTTAPGHPH